MEFIYRALVSVAIATPVSTFAYAMSKQTDVLILSYIVLTMASWFMLSLCTAAKDN